MDTELLAQFSAQAEKAVGLLKSMANECRLLVLCHLAAEGDLGLPLGIGGGEAGVDGRAEDAAVEAGGGGRGPLPQEDGCFADTCGAARV